MKQRQGEGWSPEEEERLRNAFANGKSIAAIAHQHQRSGGAIRSRLKRLGLLEEPVDGVEPDARRPLQIEPAREPGSDVESTAEPSIRLEYIDRLIAELLELKQEVTHAKISDRRVAAVTNAYARLDAALLATIRSAAVVDDDDEQQPIAVRLRTALSRTVQVGVEKLKDRHIANRVLGLIEDGEPVTLAAIADELGISRERVRQRRVRAFRSIESRIARQFTNTERLRAIFRELSAATEWDDPVQVAPIIVRDVNDHCVAAKQLTIMCCLAAGAARTAQLHAEAERAVMKACQDPSIHGRWRYDHWKEAATKAIFGQRKYFDSPPAELVDKKRLPRNARDSAELALDSTKLGRAVACESGMELRVFSWLERSAEVLWYQEQPMTVPYTLDGKSRLYYPDAAVWDGEHQIVVVEVKPLFMMYRRETVAKALAAVNHLGPLGIGYLLVDTAGRTLADLAYEPYDSAVAEEVESLFSRGPVSFSTVARVLSRRTGQVEHAEFISMVVNRDWAVSSDRVRVWKLSDGVSFAPLRWKHKHL